VLDLAITAFTLVLLAAGLRRPFLWVLAYLYIDILLPQKISWSLLASLPISLIAFVLAFLGWLVLDAKEDSRFTLRQTLIVVLLVYCGITTTMADFPEPALEKWSWVWKSLVFAVFLPLTLRTRLRIESAVLVMVLTAGAIIISGGIKTLGGGGGYGTLRLFVADNAGLYEGSTLSMVAVAMIPLVWWAARHSTIFPRDWRTTLFAIALTFACLLIPIGTQTRTGLLCIGLLAVLSLRSVKRRFLYITMAAVVALAAIPLLPESYTKRMSTIENHKADQSASTRVAVWMWTLDYAKHNPFGGGFDAYRGNKIKVEMRDVEGSGNNVSVDVNEAYDESRAYHSSYFEMLGEQGWPGLFIWLLIHVTGLWQMERLRARWKRRTGPDEQWQAPLAAALQQTQLIYLLGAAFVGIAFLPFILMVVGLQCALSSYLHRIDSPIRRANREKAAMKPVKAVAAN
jgi:probable O-glycosylation ligase (exosortase A-associated)